MLVEDVAARIRWARERMTEMVRAMEPTLLGSFLRQVFADPKIGPAFLVAPASLDHHHAFSGGLLVHSAETVWSVFRGSAAPVRLCTSLQDHHRAPTPPPARTVRIRA